MNVGQTEYVNRAFRSRAQSETEAASTRMPKNRLLAASLADLLEECRFVTTRGELEELAGKYGVDVEKLESVARFVNSPSVDEKDIVRVVESNGDEVATMTVGVFSTMIRIVMLTVLFCRLRGRIRS